MTEHEWQTGDVAALLTCLHGKVSDRKLRLFGVAMVRQVWGRLASSDCRAYERMERYCDSGDLADLGDSWVRPLTPAAEWAGSLSRCLGGEIPPGDFHLPAKLRAALLRDIVGDPFRAAPDRWKKPCRCDTSGMFADRTLDDRVSPPRCTACEEAWLPADWLTPTVLSLAHAAYNERPEDGTLDPQRLLVLADALEDAGCDSEALLGHLRQPFVVRYEFAGATGSWGAHLTRDAARDAAAACDRHFAGRAAVRVEDPPPHVRGCWAIDLVLGKE